MFSEEQNKALDDKLEALSGKMLKELGETVNKAMSGMAKRLIVDEVPKAIASQFGTFEEKLSSLQYDENKQRQLLRTEMDAWLEELNKQAADEEETEKKSSGKNNNSKPDNSQPYNELNTRFAEQVKTLEQMKQRLEAAEKIAATERENREKIAAEQRVSAMEEKVLQQLRGKVRPNTEKQLLTLLKQEGKLVEDSENNQYLLKGKDEYGIDANVGIDKALPDLIRANYPHFEDVRPGTGTSASAGSNNGNIPSGGKWFAGGTMPEVSAMLDPNNLQEMLREMDALAKR